MLVVEPCITATFGTTVPEDHSFAFNVGPKKNFHPSKLRHYYLGWVHRLQDRGATRGPARHWLHLVLQCSGRSTKEKGCSRKTNSPGSKFSLVVTNLPLTLSPLSSSLNLGFAPANSASVQPSSWGSVGVSTFLLGCSSLQRATASLLRASKSLLAASRFSGVNLENLKIVGGADGHNIQCLLSSL